MSLTTSPASIDPPPLLFGQASPDSPPQFPSHPPPPAVHQDASNMDAEETGDNMAMSGVLPAPPAQNHDRQDSETEEMDTGGGAEREHQADEMDTAPDNAPPSDLPNQSISNQPPTQPLSQPSNTMPPVIPPEASNPPPVPPSTTSAAIFTVGPTGETPRSPSRSSPASPQPGTSVVDVEGSEESSDDDEAEEEQEEEDEADLLWQEIVEDTSEPTDEELAKIEKTAEHSAYDYKYWEGKTFVDRKDPEYQPGAGGRIDWTIEKYHGTKDSPNRELIMMSPKVEVGDYEWEIKFFPHGNSSDHLSAYVVCTSFDTAGQRSPGGTPLQEETQFNPLPLVQAQRVRKFQSVVADIGLVVYSPLEPRTNYFKHSTHRFTTTSPDWGWLRIGPLCPDVHKRLEGQRSALVRGDKLGLTAYIQIINDTTQCLGELRNGTPWHSMRTTGLHGLTGFPRNPECTPKGAIAAIISWMHLQPFRQLLYDVMPGKKWKMEPARHRPMILLGAFQELLYQLRKFKEPPNVDDWIAPRHLMQLHSAFRWYGILHVSALHKMDPVQLWEFFRVKLEEEVEGTKFAGRLDEIFGKRKDRSTGKPTYRVPVAGSKTMQGAIDSATDLIDTNAVHPQVLHLELERQHFNMATKKWKKLMDKVTLDDHVTVAGVPYTLHSFIVHTGHLESGVFNAIVRPNGPRTNWFKFSHNVHGFEWEERYVECLPRSRAVEAHEGLAHGQPGPNDKAVAYVATYLRYDLTAAAFDPKREPSWDYRISHHGAFAGAVDTDAPPKKKKRTAEIPIVKVFDGEGHEENAKPSEPARPLSSKNIVINVFNATAFREHEGPGFIRDPWDKKWSHSPHLFKISVPEDANILTIRRKLAGNFPHVQSLDQVRVWIMKSSDIRTLHTEDEPTYIEYNAIDYESFEAKKSLAPLYRMWMFVIPHKLVVPKPNPETPTSTPGNQPRNSAPRSDSGPSRPPPTMSATDEDTAMSDAEDPLAPPPPPLSMTTPNPPPPPPPAPGVPSILRPPPGTLPRGLADITASMPPMSGSGSSNAPPASLFDLHPFSGIPPGPPDAGLFGIGVSGNGASGSSSNMNSSPFGAAVLARSSSSNMPPSLPSGPGRSSRMRRGGGGPGNSSSSALPPPNTFILAGGGIPIPSKPPPPILGVHVICVFVKLWDVTTQTLRVHPGVHNGLGIFMARSDQRVDHTLARLLNLSKENLPAVFRERGMYEALPVKRRRTFLDNEIRMWSVLVLVPPAPKDGPVAGVGSADGIEEGLGAPDLQTYLTERARQRALPWLWEGRVVMDWFGSERFEGDVRRGLPHGQGTKVYFSGDVYSGEFRAGMRWGIGRMESESNGNVYEGSWERDLQHGDGTLLEGHSGNRYEGGWRDGKKFGRGVTYWAQAQEDERVCRVCFEGGADAAFWDCGHVVCCLTCARQCEKCPVCRRGVKGAMRLYYCN